MGPPHGIFAHFNTNIIELQEDSRDPGSFIFDADNALMSYSPENGFTLITGKPDEPGLKNGPALDARFHKINNFVQYSQSKIAISDLLNQCIRLLDLVSNMVKPFIGKCHNHLVKRDDLVILQKDTQNVSATEDILRYPNIIRYAPKRNLFLVIDAGNKYLIKVDPHTNTAAALNAELSADVTPNTNDFILDEEEKFMYIFHTYGLTKLDMDTEDMELLIGSVSPKKITPHKPLKAGSFDKAYIGVLGGVAWLIPNQVLVGLPSMQNEAVTVLDLVNREVYHYCNGK